ncbi:zinc finger BED domain-containing protein 5-like [Onthophagus taurus]|uniref:zinc finger BED domain-containing protein 5-like n=1 Tax=Onthophagus taurus TaxID=166361 RepID=UPI0039BEC7EF
MSENIAKNVHQKLNNKIFALQIDESTDISGKAQLMGFVRLINGDSIINQFLFCQELSGRTTGKEIFDCVDNFFKNSNLSWNFCTGICTDGAPAMVGNEKGFWTYAKQKNADIITTHIIHREALVAKTLPTELISVLEDVIKIVNYIKSRPLKSRLFKELCDSMEANYNCLLLHSEVRWLSRGRVLARAYELREELCVFFKEETTMGEKEKRRILKTQQFYDCLSNELWCAKLAYLEHTFSHLNHLNSSLQGRHENILTSTDKLTAFSNKLCLWSKKVGENNLEMFAKIPDGNSLVKSHLDTLQQAVAKYFPSIHIEKHDWIRNPFTGNTSYSNLCLEEEEELISLSSDRTLKLKYSELPLNTFWISIHDEYPKLFKRAISIFQFSTSYLCELGFSTLTTIKNNKRSQLKNVEDELRVALSTIKPNIEEITKHRQSHISH